MNEILENYYKKTFLENLRPSFFEKQYYPVFSAAMNNLVDFLFLHFKEIDWEKLSENLKIDES